MVVVVVFVHTANHVSQFLKVQSTTLKLTNSSEPLNFYLVYCSPNSSIENNTHLYSFISQVKPKSLRRTSINEWHIEFALNRAERVRPPGAVLYK